MAVDTSDLKIQVQETESWSRRLSITVPSSRVARVRASVASQIANGARLPGFRKGKLPQRVIEQRFGPSIQQETLDRVIQESYRSALETEGLTPISQGQVANVKYQDGEDLEFEVEFEVQPQLELERISGFTVSRPASEITDEDVDSVLDRLRDERGEWEPLEGVKPDYGNQVEVEITALDEEGATNEGEDARSYRFVIGEGQAIPAIEEAILTLDIGAEDEFDVAFPEDFPEEERRGESRRLKIKVLSAEQKKLPELDDEFAGAVGEFENMDALRTRIRDDLQSDMEQRSTAEVRRQLVEQIIGANPFDLPGSMVDRYLDYMTGHAHGPDQERQHTPEEEERMAKVREGLRPQAELVLKRMMVVERIAEQEGLSASQDEIDARVEEIAAQHGRTPSEVWIQLEKSGQLEALEREITEDRVFQFLTEQNTVA
ncbi:trigger factor [soil metagenome]